MARLHPTTTFALLLQLFVTCCNGDSGWTDTCSGDNPRITDGRGFAGTTEDATSDASINNGQCGDVTLDSPGIWWSIVGTGELLRATSCNLDTYIKVKIAVFTGDSCDDLRCVGGGNERDSGCDWGDESNLAWDLATAYDFETRLDQKYYILVMADEPGATGDFWIHFREPTIPFNNVCVNAIGPIPRDETRVIASSTDATYDKDIDSTVGFCSNNQALYAGTWFQLFGTGSEVTLKVCSEQNYDGFEFSVYEGTTCDDLQCVSNARSTTVVSAPSQCTFSSGEFLQSQVTFGTVDRRRYYILVNYAEAFRPPVTGSLRLYVDDGAGGTAGSGGITGIDFATNLRKNGDGIVEDDGK